MGTKIAVAYANILMADIEAQIPSQSIINSSTVILKTSLLANLIRNRLSNKQTRIYLDTIRFTAEISDTEALFVDAIVNKEIKTHFRPSEMSVGSQQ